MFGLKENNVLELQIKAAEAEAMDVLNDTEESPQTRATILRQILQMKERTARFVLEELEAMTTRLATHGVSCVSLVPIAEAYQQALEASTSQMQIFAHELTGLTHNTDTEEGYSNISESLSIHTERLIRPLKESKEKALAGVDSMVYAEFFETWHNLSEKPI